MSWMVRSDAKLGNAKKLGIQTLWRQTKPNVEICCQIGSVETGGIQP